MTDQIITRERLKALSQINRWRGWTRRPYSVGEHTAIGAYVMDWFKIGDKYVKRWWMHDMHETEIVGDVPTPDKAKYMRLSYDHAVEDFDTRLGEEMGLCDGRPLWWRCPKVKQMDRTMLLVENDFMAVNRDESLSRCDTSHPIVDMVINLIGAETFATPDRVIDLWNKNVWKYGWEKV